MRLTGPCLGAAAALVFAAQAEAQTRVPGRFLLTQYWIAHETPGARDRSSEAIQDRHGRTLAWSCPQFVRSLSMEGTGRTWDGRLLNWDRRVNGRACFVEVDPHLYPFGVGVQGFALVPFRSLAVDPRFVPLGHTVELPELIGMPLPDGSRHDGCFVAVDGGGAIRGHHLDLFLPGATWWRQLQASGHLARHVTVTLDAPRCSPARRFAYRPSPFDVAGDPGDELR